MQDKPNIDISDLSPPQLVQVIADATARLDQLRAEHIAAGQALGLSLSNGKPRNKRRASKHPDSN